MNDPVYRDCITVTTPCGEVPLPAMGACNLGAPKLIRLVRFPFTHMAALNWDQLRAPATVAARFLDDVTGL